MLAVTGGGVVPPMPVTLTGLQRDTCPILSTAEQGLQNWLGRGRSMPPESSTPRCSVSRLHWRHSGSGPQSFRSPMQALVSGECSSAALSSPSSRLRSQWRGLTAAYQFHDCKRSNRGVTEGHDGPRPDRDTRALPPLQACSLSWPPPRHGLGHLSRGDADKTRELFTGDA